MPSITLRTLQGTGPRPPHRPTRARASFIAAVLALVLAARPAPGQVTFTKITDTSSGPFSSIGTPSSVNSQAPSLSGSVVAFLANSGGGHGIITAPAGGGPLTPVTNFILPNGLPIGGFLSQPATNGSTVAFVAADIGGRPGVYTAPATGSGPIALVADISTPVPNGAGNFQSFFNEEPSIFGSLVAFTSVPPGIYTGPAAGGALARVADANTTVHPGAGSPSLSGTFVAFSGFPSGGGSGIYTGPTAGGTLTAVADSTSAIPNGSGAFSSFGQAPAMSGSLVAFIGSGAGGQAGVYTGPAGGGTLTRIADAATAIPGGSGAFTGFSIVDVSGSEFAFVGTGSGGQSGIYVEDTSGGALAKLIAVGDTLGGKTVSTLFFNDGLEGSNIAFTAAFTDGSQAVYVGHITPIPEPSSLFLAGTTLVSGLAMGRRRRRADVVGRNVARLRVETLEDRTTPSGGALDPTFGTGGVATVPTDTYWTQPVTAVQPDGKILSLQSALLKSAVNSLQTTYQPIVTRLNANGTLDTTFGTNGSIKLPVARSAYGDSLAVAPDDKILVGAKAYTQMGKSGGSDTEYAVARLTASGALDTSFGNNHGWWLSNPTVNDEITLQLATVPVAGGGYSVIVGGTAVQADGSSVFAAEKLTSAGLPDTTFGTGGLAVRKVGTGVISTTNTSMTVTASGEIVFAGSYSTSGSTLFGRVLVEFTPAGQTDTGFGTGGVVTIYGTGAGGVAIGTFPGTIRGMTQAVVAAQGNNLIVAGTVVVNDPSSGSGVNSGGYVIRYTSAGALDSTFGTDGVFYGPANSITGNSQFLQVAVAADGSIAVAGLSIRKDANNINHTGLIIGHLTADGAADTWFGTDGTGLVIRYDQDPYPSYAFVSICFDPDGNILVGRVASGTTIPGHGYLMRFTVA